MKFQYIRILIMIFLRNINLQIVFLALSEKTIAEYSLKCGFIIYDNI